jgi:hypothetical protein
VVVSLEESWNEGFRSCFHYSGWWRYGSVDVRGGLGYIQIYPHN